MGYAVLETKTNGELQKLIRKSAEDTSLIVITEHAELRMLQRDIGLTEVYDVLRWGQIERPWHISEEHESVECRMERYVGGRNLIVIVALADEDPDLVVVTAMTDGDED